MKSRALRPILVGLCGAGAIALIMTYFGPSWLSGMLRAVVSYDVKAEHGPPHDRTFEVLATVEDQEVGRGSGRSKKAAEQEAARGALENLMDEEDDGEDAT